MPGETWAVVVAAGAGDRLARRSPQGLRAAGRSHDAGLVARHAGRSRPDRRHRHGRPGGVRGARLAARRRSLRDEDRRCGAGRRDAAGVGRGRRRLRARRCRVRARARRRPATHAARSRRSGASPRCAAVPRASSRPLPWPTPSSASAPTAASPRRSNAVPCAPCRRRRAFPTAVLREALAAHTADATDCASMVEALGRSVVCVDGRRTRIQGHDACRPRPRRAAGRLTRWPRTWRGAPCAPLSRAGWCVSSR